jgi:hypothetical protein
MSYYFSAKILHQLSVEPFIKGANFAKSVFFGYLVMVPRVAMTYKYLGFGV